jgi:hypothetical protein
MKRPQGYQQKLDSLIFYLMSLKGLTAVQKIILALVADCTERGPPFYPSLPALAKLCSCSRRYVWKALQGLAGPHGWIVNDWRGGRATNHYFAGWRLKRILKRYRRLGGQPCMTPKSKRLARRSTAS